MLIDGKKIDRVTRNFQESTHYRPDFRRRATPEPTIKNVWVRKFVSNLLHIGAVISSFFLGCAALGFAFGAFGFPGNNPWWMVVTIPCGIAIAAGLVSAWMVYLDWHDHR